MKAVNLRTEYLKDPIGIDCTKPRLFWNCEGGMTQTAYRVVAESETSEAMWDTGKTSGSNMCVEYSGAPLSSRCRVMWRVQLWDENDIPGEQSDYASFELGLLSPDDWQAEWISGDYIPKKQTLYPVDCFIKEFHSSGVIKARLYSTACGVYEGRLNGKRVGGFILAPGITDYRKRIQYQTYDVTSLLHDGENKLAFELADGWYRGSVGAWGLRNQYGKQTKLLAQLELTHSDGSVTVISSDNKWMWSIDGPIRRADNKDGEIVDANMSPSYSKPAKTAQCRIVPCSSNNVDVAEHEALMPDIIKTPSGKSVLDFKVNIAGYLSFSVNAKRGQRIFLRFGEMLDENGEFTQKNIQCTGSPLVGNNKVTPLQQVDYTCKDGKNEYKPKFCIFGFRYVLLDTDVIVCAEDFHAIAVYSDLMETMRFECSNELINKFVECTVRSAKGNSCDIPTDCPTRERHGWTGDAQIFAATACYLFNYSPFMRKYIRDIYDWQKKDGKLPQIAPSGGRDFYMAPLDGSVGWADAGIILPYRLWKQYGDVRILHENYDSMRSYAQFMQKRCGKRQLFSKSLGLKGADKKFAVNKGQAYGEWAEPADIHPQSWTDQVFAQPEVATAYTCYIMELMREIALELGKTEDADIYRIYADGTRKAYQALVRTDRYALDTDRQSHLVRPLFFSLLNHDQTNFARDRLIQSLKSYGWRLGTGFLSTPFILHVLSEIDIEYAYRLLENEQMPGWLFMPKNGATTIWESWEGIKAQSGIASLNHYAKGAVCEWLFSVMCGVCVSGANHFDISPNPGGKISYARLVYDSVYGRIESGWERQDGKTMYRVSIPANTTATVTLHDGCTVKAGSGEHEWVVVAQNG